MDTVCPTGGLLNDTERSYLDPDTDDMSLKTSHTAQKGQKSVPAGAAALAKGLSLLDLIADADEPLRFAELLKLSELSKPTFARILRTLIAFELVRNDEEQGTYTLGRRFLELSHRVWDTFDLHSVAGAELERLSMELGETVALCKLEDDQVVYVAANPGTGLSVHIRAGDRVPLYCTAGGKALLAFQDPSVTRALIDRTTLTPHTKNTLTTQKALESDLALTKARGYAVSYEEHLDGVNSVSTVVSAPDGTPLGALSILAPASRLGEEHIHPAGRDLIAAARRITGAAGAVAISSRPQPRSRTKDTKVVDMECVLPWGSQLGESPVWHDRQQRLYWVDILRPAVYRFDPETGVNEACILEKLVSSVLPTNGDDLIVTTQDGVEILDFESGALEPFCDPEAGLHENRLNDAKVGPGGAIWVGSMRMDAARATGGLYRVEANGKWERQESGLTVSNGLAWSPDNSAFYFVDTVPGLIYAYDCAPGAGVLSNRRVFAEIPAKDGRPDGVAVDDLGGLWVALWDGWKLRRFDASGALDFDLEVPVPRPTSLCFGGPENATMFVTSARTRLPATTLSEAPLSGGIFAMETGFRGVPTNFFEVKT